uniref:Transthyretin-like family protein n=1 Tax=Panagrolaimus sp. JU765 TaxID=591449 RepID=A0AC34RA29_9BILA
PSGQFEVTGNTNGRDLNETTIEPTLAIYHQCDDPKDTKGYRRFLIKVPEKFVTQGRIAKKTFDVGTLNLQITYPGEIRDKNFKPKP